MSSENNNVNAVLMGMGNPLLDISAEVGQDILDKYELKLNNAILATDAHRPLYREIVEKYNVSYIAGGATQNSIRVAQWMLQEKGATAYVGCVGQDEFGRQLRTCATNDGVAVYYLEDAKIPTGTCACLIKDKERSLVADLNAATHFKVEHLSTPSVAAVWQQAKYFYIAGFFITSSPPSLMHIARHACETNKVFTMNLSAPFICQFFDGPLLEAMPYVDILFGNETEAKAFGEKQGYSDLSLPAIAKQIVALPKANSQRKRVVVFTQGANPTYVVEEDKVTEVAVPHVPSEEIVDANGAGDAFVGGFLAYLVKGKSLVECANAGNYSARTILAVSGTVLPSHTPNVPQ